MYTPNTTTPNFDEWLASPKGTPRSYTLGEDLRSTPLRMSLPVGVRTPETLLAAAAQLEQPAEILSPGLRPVRRDRADKTPDRYSSNGPTTPKQQIQSPSLTFPVNNSTASVADTDAANLLVMLHNSPSPSFISTTSSPQITNVDVSLPSLMGVEATSPREISYGGPQRGFMLSSTSPSTSNQMQQSNTTTPTSPNLWRSSSTPPPGLQHRKAYSSHKSSDSPSRLLQSAEKRRRAANNNNAMDTQALQSWYPVVRSPLSREVSLEIDGVESRRSRSVPPSQLSSLKEGVSAMSLLEATASSSKRKDRDFETWQDPNDRQEEEGYHSSMSSGEIEGLSKYGSLPSEREIKPMGLFKDDDDEEGDFRLEHNNSTTVAWRMNLDSVGQSTLRPQATKHDHLNHNTLIPPPAVNAPSRAFSSTTTPTNFIANNAGSAMYSASMANDTLFNSSPSNATASGRSRGTTTPAGNSSGSGSEQRRWSHHSDHRPPSPARFDDKVVLKVEVKEEPGQVVIEQEVSKNANESEFTAGMI